LQSIVLHFFSRYYLIMYIASMRFIINADEKKEESEISLYIYINIYALLYIYILTVRNILGIISYNCQKINVITLTTFLRTSAFIIANRRS